MMKSPPTSTLVMIQTKRSLQFLIVPLNAPSNLRQSDQWLWRNVGRHRGQPEFSGLFFAFRPFGNQPFKIARLVPVFIPMSWSNSQKEKPRSHLPPRSFSPTHVFPKSLGGVLSQVHDGGRLATRTAPNSRRRAPLPRPLLGRKRLLARRPYSSFFSDPDNI